MATFAFWNVGGQPINDEIASLCHENSVDVLVLAECPLSEPELLLALNKDSLRSTYVSPFNPSPRLKFVTRYPPDRLKYISDSGGLSARLITPPVGIEVLLIAVHLPSKMYMTDAEQAFHSTRVGTFIRNAEDVTGNRNSLLLGDFNMDPFEDGMVGADGIHGVMDLVPTIGEE